MRSIAEIKRRHARFYLDALYKLNQHYRQGGDKVPAALQAYEIERPQIDQGQAWAAERWARDADAAQLCEDYADVGADILFLRHDPASFERWWMQH